MQISEGFFVIFCKNRDSIRGKKEEKGLKEANLDRKKGSGANTLNIIRSKENGEKTPLIGVKEG